MGRCKRRATERGCRAWRYVWRRVVAWHWHRRPRSKRELHVCRSVPPPPPTAAPGSVFPMGTETCESSAAESDAPPPPLPLDHSHPENEAKKATLSPPPPLPLPRPPSLPSLAGSHADLLRRHHRPPSPPLSTQRSCSPPQTLGVSLAYFNLPPLRCNPTPDPGSTRKCPRILVSSAWSLLGCTKFGLFRWVGSSDLFSYSFYFPVSWLGFCHRFAHLGLGRLPLSRPPHILIR